MGGSMALARYVVDAVVLENRGVREVARDHGVSKSWVSELVRRYREGGYEALEPRSRRAKSRPNRTPDDVEDEIVRIRKSLAEHGFDAGAHTIHWHLAKTRDDIPSISTIWRVLSRRGFIEPEPKKRPHNSFIRFEGALPNECWQADCTHWQLKRGTDVEILDMIDDYSRLIVAARVTGVTKVHDVVSTFHEAGARWGYPASVLTGVLQVVMQTQQLRAVPGIQFTQDLYDELQSYEFKKTDAGNDTFKAASSSHDDLVSAVLSLPSGRANDARPASATPSLNRGVDGPRSSGQEGSYEWRQLTSLCPPRCEMAVTVSSHPSGWPCL